MSEKEKVMEVLRDLRAVCTAHFWPSAGAFSGPAGRRAKYWMPLPFPPTREDEIEPVDLESVIGERSEYTRLLDEAIKITGEKLKNEIVRYMQQTKGAKNV